MELIQSKALWETAAQVNAELKELTPLLLSPTVGPEFEISAKVEGEAVTASPLRCMMKRDAAAGSYLLLAVNVDDAVLTATVTLPKPLNNIRVLFENRTAPSADATRTRFTDRFEPFDVHVYRLTFEKPATNP
jgi:hypothetical protein